MTTSHRHTTAALLGAVFCIATAGLVYELVAGTAASYLLGDSVTQFSFVIGAYLFAMGVGSYLTKFIEGDLIPWFVRLELAVGVAGGFAATLLFLTFSRDGSFRLVLYLLVGAIGIGVGLEIPILIRILKDRMRLEDLIAKVLFFDYLGALAASLLFPLLLVPKLGLIKTSLVLGLLNAVVGAWVVWLFRDRIAKPGRLAIECAICVVILAAGLWQGERLTRFVENDLFPHEIVAAESSRYQRIVVTRSKTGEVRLHLNGHLQFSSADEYRYHEALVHPAMANARATDRRGLRVLILGGGDGLGAREVLKYGSQVAEIVLVDLDPAVTDLFTRNGELAELNEHALSNDKVTVVNTDAMAWLEDHPEERFDVVIIDFPDPGNYSVGKLYTKTFYRMVWRALEDNGVMTVQSTSPLVARRSFWCIARTIGAADFHVLPYHIFVPSFGAWGFVLAGKQALPPPRALRRPVPPGLRFLADGILAGLFEFPRDMGPTGGDAINRLNNQQLVRIYDEEWASIR